MNHVVGIVQARMGSSRLPGKVLMPLAGQCLLGYLLERLTSSRELDLVMVATSDTPQDDTIVRECQRLGVLYFRGSEADVLGRYYEAAMAGRADVIVRITADNPFTDPVSIDRVVRHLTYREADYAVETGLPVGVSAEAFTWETLRRMHAQAHRYDWREHVTLYAKDHPDEFRCAFLPPRPDVHRPDLLFTVDTREDFERVRKLADLLPHPHFYLKNLIDIADEVLVEGLISASPSPVAPMQPYA